MRNYLPAVLVLVCSIIAFNCKGSEGPVGPTGESYESLTDPAIKPLVLTTYPSNKSVGPYLDYTNRVTIWFNKIMDRTSMKHALHLTSSLGDVQLDTTSVSVQNTNAFTITPLDARGSSYKFLWKINQQYSLTVDSGAVDVNGNVLGSAFTMTFTPEPYFRIISMAPVAGTAEVGTTSTITLTLNSPVDSSFFQFIHISPALIGQWVYTPGFPGPDSTIVKYSFKNAMNDTQYTVTVDPSANDKYGHHFQSAYSSSFTTTTIRVSTTTPLDASINVPVVNSVTVSLTAPIDTSTVFPAFSISPAIAGNLIYAYGGSSFSFKPATRFMTNTLYTISVSNALKSKGGSPFQPYSFSFRTIPFQISTSTPADGSGNIALNARITMTLTDNVDTGTVRGAFSIVPSIPGTLLLQNDSPTFSFVPSNGFGANMTYTVTLSSGLHSKSGDSLVLPNSFSFSTASVNVTSTTPVDGTRNIALNSTITVNVDAPLDTTGIQNDFIITPSVPGWISTFEGSTSFTFHPVGELAENTNYSVTIPTTLQSTGGGGLSSPYSFAFSTAPFQVTTTSVTNGSVGVSKTLNSIVFTLNGNINSSTVAGAFSSGPNIPGSFNNGTSSFTYNISGALQANTTYTITISTGLQTKEGVSLDNPYTLTFTTGD